MNYNQLLAENLEKHRMLKEKIEEAIGLQLTQPDLSYSVREIIDKSLRGQTVPIKQYNSYDDAELTEEQQHDLQCFADRFEAMQYVKNIALLKTRLKQLKVSQESIKKRIEEAKRKNEEKQAAETQGKISKIDGGSEE